MAILGVVLWVYTNPGKERLVTLHLHSTQLFSGALFILMAVLLLNGSLTTFNNLIRADLALWFADIEDKIVQLFS